MKAKAILRNQIKDRKNVSSYIFYGSDQEFVYQAARDFATGLGVSDFDIVEIEPEARDQNSKDEIKIKAVRELIRQINLTPGHGEKKLAIIKQADKLNSEAANTLLKTLEEPPTSSTIILLSSDLKLISTIISRCQVVRFADRTGTADQTIIRSFLALGEQHLKKIFATAEKLSTDPNLDSHLETLLVTFRDQLIKSPTPSNLEKIKAVFEARRNLRITNNRRLVLENLLLKFIYG